MITYRYAKSINDKVIDVSFLDNVNRRSGAPYRCLGCKAELIPNIPKTNKSKYFSHKAIGNCSKETYLHVLAKNAFYDEYLDALDKKSPFIFVFNRPFECTFFESSLKHICRGSDDEDFDLTQKYKKILMEEKIGEFVPDLALLSDTSPTIYIEIAVTHKASVKKISSGIKIIEINIASESDIQPIFNRRISENYPIITTHNIQGKLKIWDKCGGECKKEAEFFVVHPNGKAEIINKLPSKVLSQFQKFEVIHPVIEDANSAHDGFKRLLENLRFHHFSGKKIRSCLLCKHQTIGEESGIKCRLKNQKIYATEAIKCDQYDPYVSMRDAEEGGRKNLNERIEKGNKLVEKLLRGWR
jgi:hypothetical protein